MPATEAHIRATTKYESKAYDKILLRLRKDSDINKESITKAAENAGMSLNGYILDAIQDKMEGNKADQKADQKQADPKEIVWE